MKLKERAAAIKLLVPAVFLAMKKRETPIGAKIIAGVTVAYALSPIDLIPDFIPVLGYLDDLLILPLLISIAVRLIPREILDQCKQEAEGLWQTGKPKKWLFAIPIAVIWIAVIAVIAYHLY